MAEAIDPWANCERLPHPPMMPGNAAATRVSLIVRCRDCGHQVEPDPAEMAARYGAETAAVLDWRERLVCARCWDRQVDMVARVKCAHCRRAPSTPVAREWGRESPLVRTSLHGLPRRPGVDCPT
jgi:hypothetical protein